MVPVLKKLDTDLLEKEKALVNKNYQRLLKNLEEELPVKDVSKLYKIEFK